MPTPAAPPDTNTAVTDPDSLIGLSTVSKELSYIAAYLEDVKAGRPTTDEKRRIRTALFQAQADLNFVITKLLATTIGQDIPSGETN